MKFDKKKLEKKFGVAWQQAQKLAKDKASLLAMVGAAKEKSRNQRRTLDRFHSELTLLLSLVRNYALKRYRELSWKSIVLAVAAVIYFLNPFDLIPDFLLGGLFDDGVVLSWIILAIKDELAHFQRWEEKQKALQKKELKK